MRRLIFVSCAMVALSACGGKQVVENQSAAENLPFESTLTNDASALEQVEAENARMQIPESGNEADANAATANTDTNKADTKDAASNTAGNSN